MMGFEFTNLMPNEVFRWSLALVCGRYLGSDRIDVVEVSNISDAHDKSPVLWPTVKGAFKAFVNLVPGTNVVRLRHGDVSHDLVLKYERPPPCIGKYVRLVYVICQDDPDEGCFQGPLEEDCSVGSAMKRIALGVQILQAVFAETLSAAGFQRKSFRLEHCNSLSTPVVHVFRSKLVLAEARSMKAEALWSHLAVELMNSDLRNSDTCKFLAFVSWTRYKTDVEPKSQGDVLSRTTGHVMIGAGGLALCGTGCLYTWAADVQELPRRLGDRRKVDRLNYMDLSNYRGTLSACYSSSLGGVLHELGHVFDLVHADKGIMGHGFHDLSLLYAVSEDPHIVGLDAASRPKEVPPETLASISSGPEHSLPSTVSSVSPSEESGDCGTPKRKLQLTRLEPKARSVGISAHRGHIMKDTTGGPYWSRSCAVILNYHKWINHDIAEKNQTPIEFTGSSLASPHGIRLVEFRHPDDSRVVGFWEFPEGPVKVSLDRTHIRRSVTEYLENEHSSCKELKQVEVFAIDSLGNILKTDFRLC